MKLLRYSAFPCPKGCCSSAGLEENLMLKKAIREARRSIVLLKASESMAMLDMLMPIISFKTIRRASQIIARLAAPLFVLNNCLSIF